VTTSPTASSNPRCPVSVAVRLSLVRRLRAEYVAACPNWMAIGLAADPGMARVDVTFEMTDGRKITIVYWQKGGFEGEQIKGFEPEPGFRDGDE